MQESAVDFTPALAQMCIKALAADIRELESAEEQRKVAIEGRIVNTNGSEEPINLREVLNKVIHGTPTSVVVTNGVVRLHFRNNKSKGWTEAWFSGTQLLRVLNGRLDKLPYEKREAEIMRFLQNLGVERFLPSSASGNPETVDPTQGSA